MTDLPVCRWRQELTQGQLHCHSAKYCFSPNQVTAQFCLKCQVIDHEPPTSSLRAMPCVHLGKLLRSDDEATPADRDPQFVCAIHGTCQTTPLGLNCSIDDRSCVSCSDYASRDPFGPDSETMRNRAEQHLESIPPYPEGRYRGRGIVIVGDGKRFFASLYITIRALRHLGCTLPIQVWYLGRKREMPKKRQSLLKPFDVEFVDADALREHHPARCLDGWELKVFAALHSPFEELLFLDADSYPCRNPEFLFDREDYQARGAIFWPDLMGIDDRLNWTAFGVADPRRLGSIESGQFVIHKRISWQPLNLTWFYNDHSDYYYRYCHGDKHTFEVAWARCRQPFVMWQPQSYWNEVAIMQSDPDGAPLFVHRCRDKFRLEDHSYNTPQFHTLPAYYSSLPMEDECWTWLTELADVLEYERPNPGAVQIVKPKGPLNKAASRFAIATMYTREIAEYGEINSRALASYAKRHGYQLLVARDILDASRHPAWSKLLLIERFLVDHPKCEWLMWIDADAVITNPNQKLEDLIDDTVDFLVAIDAGESPINTGVFLIRNCAATLEMLRLAYTKIEYLSHPCWEQPALAKAMKECSATVRTRIVSRRLFNSFHNEHKVGDFIIHFAGCHHSMKLAGVTKAIEISGRPNRETPSKKRLRDNSVAKKRM